MPQVKTNFSQESSLTINKDAMFSRIKSYRNKDGTWRHYLYLVATKRIGGKVRQARPQFVEEEE